ncbi:NAD(P)/FAD-dependent oxidoreductase [Aeromicrobium sp.]|uniref:NAD(P)/FAD-dependent oxidoreductase n=1 Tax=Aeromicrobium sp. TaxID=1871063 RepID=UPI0025C6C68A|nr:NAD(P)/FAD-dependent oxidoreductase [Aeromicrobium sp.]MCK5892461.1 NAD(P)/FAD-dependent oxidoreductase [Aeromicrobium sp.]
MNDTAQHDSPLHDTAQHDALVIGGGPAGLQATLSLARVHRTVLHLDSGVYRNAPERHLHNLIGHDGQDPAELRAAARRDIAAYGTVTSVAARVVSLTGEADDFTAVLDDGSTRRARHVVLATGVRDELPPIEGLTELWGRGVAHCPFCHGHELSGGAAGVIGTVPGHLLHLAGFFPRISRTFDVFSHGTAVDAETRAVLDAYGATVHDQVVERVTPQGEGLVVHLAAADPVRLDGVFVAPTVHQAAPFAEQLGLEVSAMGSILVDAFARTSVPGVYAAGDAAHHRDLPMAMASVANAIGAGALAGGVCVADLMVADRAALLAPTAGR